MKFALSWLKAHLDTEASLAEIVARLTAIGLEVEDVDDPAVRLQGFLVARVLTAAPHPGADKLRVLTVDAGDATPRTVVCGAPNARAGLVGVLGLPGATVPANGMVLKIAAIRGVESHGMLCSARELGLGDSHEGIIELPADTPIGTPFAQISTAGHAGADPVITIAVTPNRPDCLGIHGIARDLAAAGLGVLRPIDAAPVAGAFPCPIAITIEDTQGCPAFYGRVIRGVTNGPSPAWLQARLASAGQRSISALVDITNYLMLSYGRPAHVYDLARLTGPLTVRRAHPGEIARTLDGRDHPLDPRMTVIADAAQAHSIAGIIGGAHSGVSEATRDVLLEIAYFAPERIATTGRARNLTSEARARFERGVDRGFLDVGIDLATRLILDLCGGEASTVVRAGTPPIAHRDIRYHPALAATLGGITLAPAEQARILTALGFVVAEQSTDHWLVTPPSWRPDIDGPADLVEEVVRIHGLDHVASVPLPRPDGVARPTATREQKLERRVRRAAAARGLHEAITWSFLSEKEAAAVGGGHWVLQNPISEEMKVMRPSLLPGLLAVVRRNLARGTASVRLFEIGRRYLEDGEHPTLALVLAGEKASRGWDMRVNAGKAQNFDAFDAKAAVLDLLRVAGAPVENLPVMGEAGGTYHPGQSATLRLGPRAVLARFGMIHPATLQAFDIEAPAAAAELYLDAIPAPKAGPSFVRAPFTPPALQAVTRDFAFLVPIDTPAGDLARAVKGADKANIVAARIFDDFRGNGVPEGHKSLGLEVTLQPVGKSYDEAALQAIATRIVAAAAKLGAVLRG